MTRESIEQRIAELEKERDAFVQQANAQIVAYNAVINELRRLIAPPVEANGHVPSSAHIGERR